MTRARDFANVISGNFDLPAGALDNAATTPPTITTSTSSGTWNRPTGCKQIRITLQGGGGGGGGAKTSDSSSMAVAGGGGGGGCYITNFIDVTNISTFDYTVGSGGSLGSGAGPNAGGAGGTTSTTINSVLYSAGGGGYGYEAGSTATQDIGRGGLGGHAYAFQSSTFLDESYGQEIPGQPGGTCDYLVYSSTGEIAGANGGSSHFGGGPRHNTLTGAGTAGPPVVTDGYGQGGVGGLVRDGGSNIGGGAGRAGLIVIEEFY